MTVGRLIHFVAVTALASGVLVASVVAKAQGEQSPIQATESKGGASTKPASKKRTSQSRKALDPADVTGEAAAPDVAEATVETEKRVAARADKPELRLVPLPPHRPDIQNMSTQQAPASETAKPLPQQLSSYPAPSVQHFEPYPVLGPSSLKAGEGATRPGDAQAKETTAKEQTPHQSIASLSVPLPPARPLSAAPSDSGVLAVDAVTSPTPSVPDLTGVAPSAVLSQVPMPPIRPDLPEMQEQAEAPAGNVQLASYQQIPTQGSDDQSSTGERPANWLERLFNVSPDTASKSSDAEEQPRRLSKLNRIIGDDPVRAAKLRPLISRHAAENGIPFMLADAVVRIESRYNSAARNGPYMGLMQIHHRTARSLGYNGDASGLFDPDTNLRYGIKYLAMAYRLAGGDTCGTILRYQAGHRATSMTLAARSYCSKVKMIHAELTR